MGNNFSFSIDDLVERYSKNFNEYNRPKRYFIGKDVEYILNECRGIYNTVLMLDREQLEDLCKRACMSPATLTMMAKVGAAAPRLMLYKDKLPARYTKILEVAGMDDAQINRAIAQGVLHPGAKTIPLRRFQGKNVSGVEQKPDEITEWRVISGGAKKQA